MAGREKINDSEKARSISVQFTDKQREDIELKGIGNTFSQKVKSLIWGDKMELQDIYNQGFDIGKFHGDKIRTFMLQITSESTKDFRVQKLLEIGVLASLPVPEFLVSYLKGGDVDREYYMFLLGINNGMYRDWETDRKSVV